MTRVDRQGWQHAIETSAVLGLAVLATASLTGSVRPAPLFAVALVVVLAVTVSVAVTTGSGPLTWLAGLTGAGALLWLGYTHVRGLWTVGALTAWAVGLVVLTPAGAIAYAKHRDQAAADRAADERARMLAELRKWSDLLESVNIHGVKATRVVKTRAGHTITYRLPGDGTVKVRDLIDAAPRIDIARELRTGWTRFTEGKHAREAIMYIRERDVLADDIAYPNDLTPLTINEPFDIGWAEDGSLCLIHFREIRLLIIGETGAGKTNLLNVLIAQLSRMVDVIIFGIDVGKNGRLLAPWIKPWINKQTKRPVIDWPATDRSEAEKVLAAMIRLIDARSRGFAGKNDKIIPTKDQHTYVVVIDELGDLFTTDEPKELRDKYHAGEPTPRSLSWLGTQIVGKGRSEAVDMIGGTQRSTTSHVPSNIKSQCGLRIGLGAATVAEASNLLPDSPAAQKIMALLDKQGTGVVWRKDQRPHADKFYYLPVDRIAPIAVHTGNKIRPEPNDFDRAALGDDYATRWERLSGLLHGWADYEAPPPADASTFGEIVAQLPQPSGLNAWQMKAIEIVAEAGTVGTRVGIVTDKLKTAGLGVERETVQRFFRSQAHDGFLEHRRHGMWRILRHDIDHRSTGTDGP